MIKKYLIAGLLVWLPLAVTVWLLHAVWGVLDQLFVAFLGATQWVYSGSYATHLQGLRDVPGLSVVVVLAALLLTGLFAANFMGQWALRQAERILRRIPIVKSIYSSVKQVSDTLFSSNGNAFRQAVLVQYPRPEAWTIAFVTGQPSGEVAAHFTEPHISLYVPTTPNPTSGFFIMVPASAVRPLAMSVDEALKYIISMGVVAPTVSSNINESH
jgi:uncharacterized membrane protein